MNTNFFTAKNDLTAEDRYSGRQVDKRDGRGDFAIDRDRVLYSKAFRRLSDKTQVFFSDEIKDLRTRLTHTLEVNQIAKTIVTSLGCNLDLTEAIALGHDVGHTPFGHVGERTLSLIMNNCEQLGIVVADKNKGFKHNLQSLRVLCDLEGDLNLSKYTLWGIVNHSGLQYKPCMLKQGFCYNVHHPSVCPRVGANKGHLSCQFYDDFLTKIGGDSYWSIEGLVVAQADEIAQRHHDIEDSIRFRILDRKTLVDRLSVFNDVFTALDRDNYDKLKALVGSSDDEFLAQFSRLIVKAYVVNLIEETKRRINQKGEDLGISSAQDFRAQKHNIPIADAKSLVSFTAAFEAADKEFHNFLKSTILNSYGAQSMDGKGAYIIRRLFEAYLSNPCQLPDEEIARFYAAIRVSGKSMGEMRGEMNNYRNTDPRRNSLMRVITDFIAGMTDAYAYNQYDLLYGTVVR